MTAASGVVASLGLEDHGLEWLHSPSVLAHLRPNQPAAMLHRDLEATVAGLEEQHRGDGEPWRELLGQWDRFGRPTLDAMLGPVPPLRAGARLLGSARSELWDLLRMSVLPVRTLAEERFGGEAPALLLTGNALHSDVGPGAAPSAFLGWLLVGLGQTVGFPVPRGGAGALAGAFASRMQKAGAELRTQWPMERIEVRNGRAVAVHGPRGSVRARHAVLAACDAQLLYGSLLRSEDLPPAFLARMRGFHRADATVKVDYALSAPVPWSDPQVSGAGTVHLADGMDELTTTSAQLQNRWLPSHPFLLIGQMTTSDPTRSPAGTESMWAYTHVPQRFVRDAAGEIEGGGTLSGKPLADFVDRMQRRIEEHAPGFGDLVLDRRIAGPDDLEAANPSLVGGDISGGSARLHQQLVFRPVPGLARPETPVGGLFLASSSAHPGGSVHGAAGANAARAAVAHRRLRAAARIAAVAAAAVPAVAAGRVFASGR